MAKHQQSIFPALLPGIIWLTTTTAPQPAHAVLGGSFIPSSSFSTTHPFRGAVQSGGGTGMILFRDGNTAVVLTVAHGYDLTSKTGQEVMDYKLNSDGGLKPAYSSTGATAGDYAAPLFSSNIIKSNKGLWRYFQFADAESCPLMNAGQHAGGLDNPYGCTGLGPDIDLALQLIELTDDAAARDYPEVLGPKSFAPLTVGMEATLVRTYS